MQVVGDTAPDGTEYFPAEQPKQFDAAFAPAVGENFPAAHWRHLADESAPRVDEYVPATQLVQAYTPMFENVPAAQVLQVGPVRVDGVYRPAGQVEHVDDPATEYVPARQDEQIESVLPVLGENKPAMQFVQTAWPVLTW